MSIAISRVVRSCVSSANAILGGGFSHAGSVVTAKSSDVRFTALEEAMAAS